MLLPIPHKGYQMKKIVKIASCETESQKTDRLKQQNIPRT